ncbi:DUF192 domain-containing protein [Candidatus Woesearchaeota archaeon]|nr:DUF192 domain-containing protein [Candidatus Woesearchaeota archaeon]
MLLKNITKNKVLHKDARILGNILLKSVGLMFSVKQDKALIFKFKDEKIISLHMLFVFYPIDVIFLDKNRIVVDKKDDFRPFTFYASKKKAMYAVELSNGAIKKTKIEIGDKIGF